MLGKKICAMLLAGIMAVSLSSCGKKETSVDAGDKITLKWVFTGPGEQRDSQKVWAEVNKKIKEFKGLENVDLEFECINASDFAQRILLMQTSGEKYDILSTYGLDFSMEVKNGSLMELDELLNNFAQDTKSESPGWIIGMGQKDGKTYFIPSYQAMCRSDPGIVIPTSLLDKYGDKEKIEKAYYNSDYYDADNWDAVEELLRKMKAGGDLGLGYYSAGYIEPVSNGWEEVIRNFVVRYDDKNAQLYFADETTDMQEGIKRMSEWYQKGYIRKDVLSADVESDKKGTGGYTISQVGVSGNGVIEKEYASKYGEEFTAIRSRKYNYVLGQAAGGGLAIAANCEHPEEAMRVIDVFSTEKGKEIYNMVLYGLEGVQYTKVDGDTINLAKNAGIDSSSSYGQYHWVVGNSKLRYEEEKNKGIKQWQYEVENEGPDTRRSHYIGFVANLGDISVEYAKICSLRDEYMHALSKGAAADTEALYNEYMTKLKTAGLDKVKNSLQKQVYEFLNKQQ